MLLHEFVFEICVHQMILSTTARARIRERENHKHDDAPELDYIPRHRRIRNGTAHNRYEHTATVYCTQSFISAQLVIKYISDKVKFKRKTRPTRFQYSLPVFASSTASRSLPLYCLVDIEKNIFVFFDSYSCLRLLYFTVNKECQSGR